MGCFEVVAILWVDSELDAAHASMDYVHVIFKECAVCDRCEYKVWTVVRIAEDVTDEGFVDTHAVLHEHDSAVGGESWHEGTNGVDGMVCFDAYNE